MSDTLLDDYLDVLEAAARMAVNPEALKRRLREGSFPGRKVRGVWLVHRDDVTYAARHGEDRLYTQGWWIPTRPKLPSGGRR